MTFRTDGLAKAYAGAQNESIQVKAFAETHSAALAAGNVSANLVQQVMGRMRDAIDRWDSAAGLPGMQQYARDQEDDQTYDVVAEFLAMRGAAANCRDWVVNNFPTSGGFIQKDTYEADGNITVRVFSSVETAALQTLLTTLAATIV